MQSDSESVHLRIWRTADKLATTAEKELQRVEARFATGDGPSPTPYSRKRAATLRAEATRLLRLYQAVETGKTNAGSDAIDASRSLREQAQVIKARVRSAVFRLKEERARARENREASRGRLGYGPPDA